MRGCNFFSWASVAAHELSSFEIPLTLLIVESYLIVKHTIAHGLEKALPVIVCEPATLEPSMYPDPRDVKPFARRP